MPSKRAEPVFPHETAEMQANLLLRREDNFSHVPCTRDFAKFLNEMRDPLGFFSSSNGGNGCSGAIRFLGRGEPTRNSMKAAVNVMLSGSMPPVCCWSSVKEAVLLVFQRLAEVSVIERVVSITGTEDDSRTRSIESEQSFLFLYPSPETAIVIRFLARSLHRYSPA